MFISNEQYSAVKVNLKAIISFLLRALRNIPGKNHAASREILALGLICG
jgi:hypothetical protein